MHAARCMHPPSSLLSTLVAGEMSPADEGANLSSPFAGAAPHDSAEQPAAQSHAWAAFPGDLHEHPAHLFTLVVPAHVNVFRLSAQSSHADATGCMPPSIEQTPHSPSQHAGQSGLTQARSRAKMDTQGSSQAGVCLQPCQQQHCSCLPCALLPADTSSSHCAPVNSCLAS